LWLSYLFVLFYLAVAAGAVTHADLFLENPVKLPFLNIELPLLAFFFLAPILFIIVHAYTLVHLVILGDKARRFHQLLHDQISDDKTLPEETQQRNAAIRAGLRRQLTSNIFVQFLAGPREVRESSFGALLYGIAWITLAAGPVLLLLLIQIQFLPFHSSFVTWIQRIALGIDLVLLSWLWRKVMAGRDRRLRWNWAWAACDALIGIAAILFSWTVVTFPGEWQETDLPSWRILPTLQSSEPRKDQSTGETGRSVWAWAKGYWDWIRTSETVSFHEWLFNSEVDPTTRRRLLPFSNTLLLTGFNVLEGLGIDDPKKVESRDFVFRARGRNLKGAIFDFASLARVDFTGANLEGASLRSAQLDRVSFDGAQLQGAYLGGAWLKGASLGCEELPSGGVRCAQLQGAKLQSAQLQGATLKGAGLQGASLDNAQLQAATLGNAQLQGASLASAVLQGASLEYARLQGAFLDYAQLQGASLEDAQLQGASLGGGEHLTI
jgi:uncharacterized protein YjbI with pentapeptide repeats